MQDNYPVLTEERHNRGIWVERKVEQCIVILVQIRV